MKSTEWFRFGLFVFAAVLFTISTSNAELTFNKYIIASANLPWTLDARSISVIDLDDDGDMDVLVGESRTEEIKWYENDGQNNFSEHIIMDVRYSISSVFSNDIDHDGDLDVFYGGSDKIKWWRNDGHQNFAENTIENDLIWVRSVCAADLDGDNHTDLIGADHGRDNDTTSCILWWENSGFEIFKMRTIAIGFWGAKCVSALDMDQDDDIDILGAAQRDGEIAWWENDGDANFSEHNITDDYEGVSSVLLNDLDLDGDIDVISAADNDDEGIMEINWWENDGRQRFTRHTILNDFSNAREIYACDVDNDGDIDVLGAGNDEIVWCVNDGNQEFEAVTVGELDEAATIYAVDMDGDGWVEIFAGGRIEIAYWKIEESFFEIHSISDDARVRSIKVVDMDGDGDKDLCCGNNYNVSWWENDGNQSFEEYLVFEEFFPCKSVATTDIGGDGDLDIIGVSFDGDGGGGGIRWWENDGEMSFDDHEITYNQNGYNKVHAVDIDSDSDIDIIALSNWGECIEWWENDGQQNFSQRNLVEGFRYCNDFFPIDLDGDDDFDIIGSSGASAGDAIRWWENEGEGNFSEHIVSDSIASKIIPTDLDRDGDIDIVCANGGVRALFFWLENDGQQGFTVQTISYCQIASVAAEDMDGDGDGDLISAEGEKASWWENDGHQRFSQHRLPGDYWARCIDAVDLDDDDYNDILAASSGNIIWWENLIDEQGIGDRVVEVGIPARFELVAVYPNPFNPSVVAIVGLPNPMNLNVNVYNILGCRISTLANGWFSAGEHSFKFDASGVAGGVYIIRASVPGQRVLTRKIVLTR